MDQFELKNEVMMALEDSKALKLLIYDLLKNKLQLTELTEHGWRALQKEEILEMVGWNKK